MSVDRNRRVANAERFAYVILLARDADRYLNSLCGGVRGTVQAVVVAADAEIAASAFYRGFLYRGQAVRILGASMV
jgi:hypothetical protein